MKIRILFIALLFSTISWGQFSIAAFGTNYTQNFNGLASTGAGNAWGNNTTLTGWYARTTGGTGATLSAYDTSNGGSTAGALYSYGVAGTNVVTERALGYLNSNSFTGSSGTAKGYLGWRLKNTTGASISSITVTWTGEEWRRTTGAGASTISLFYQTGTTVTDLITGTWTSASSVFTAPNLGATIALDGNATGNRTAGITVTIPVSLAAGDEIMLRWEDLNDVGTDHCIAIDDVTVSADGVFTAVANGDWSTPATWDKNAVPGAGSSVVIPSPYTVFLTSGVTRNSGTTTTVAVGGTLATADIGVANTNTYTNSGTTTTINGTFRIEGNGTVAGSNLVYGATGTLNFNNTAVSLPGGKTIVNSDFYWPTSGGPFNVNVIGDITMSAGAPRTVNGTFTTGTKASTGVSCTATSKITIGPTGTLRIDAGGLLTGVNTAGPVYGTSSLLLYNTGVSTAKGLEWIATGAGTINLTVGYPNHVQISNNTTLTYNSPTAARAMNGNFTIDTGSTFDMTGATTSNLTVAGILTNNGVLTYSPSATSGGAIIVTGNFINAGTVTMPTLAAGVGGASLLIGGNFSNLATGVFNGANRPIFFTKAGTQTISNLSASTLTFGSVTLNGASTVVQLLNDLIIAVPLNAIGNYAFNYFNAANIFDLNGHTLTLGTAGLPNVINGSGSLKGSTTSNLILLGTGSIGNLKFATDLNLATFTMNRTAATVGCVMTSALTINTNVVLTSGHIDLGAATMTLAAGVNPTGSNNSHIIADVSAGGILNKVVSATGTNYVFPIGSGGTEYAPATVNFSAGSFATATLGLAVENTIHPNWSSAASYINRYWSLTSTGITAPTYDFSATYPAADVVGSITANFKSNQWDGSDWSNGGTAITSGTISKTGCTLNTAPNHISAAIRDQEIEVKSGVAGITIPNGTTTTAAFGNAAYNTQTIGSNTPHTFSIYNRGGVALNLTGAPIVEILAGASSGDFVVTTQPSASTINAESSLTFVITFTPSFAGYRTATVRISNNDNDENPYTFVVDGTGDCAIAASNSITPTSGPVGTEVTITALTNNLYSATAAINGVAASVSSYSPSAPTATIIKVIIPVTAVSGALVTTNNIGCQASNTFTVLDTATTSCQGGTTATDLFISEVTDSNAGALSYVEIYNGTGSPKTLTNYSIKVANNGGAYTLAMTLSGTLASGGTHVIALGNDSFCGTPGGNGSLAAQTSAGSSVNFAVNGHDHYGLFNSAVSATVPIDSWGTFGSNNWAPASISTEGATFRRKNTVTVPSTTYSNSDWNITDFIGTGAGNCGNNDYSNIGQFNFRTGTPPLVTTLSFTPTCKATTLTVTATEGFTGGNALVYTWYAAASGSNVWSAISNGGIYSGATTNILSISNISTLVDYQFYCQVSENTATCFTASNAVKITLSQATTWQAGNTWSNSVPDINKPVIIDNDYDTANGFSPSFDACSLTINNAKTVTIRANNYANIQYDLTVNAGGTLTVESDGSLVMVSDTGAVTNNGTTQIKRTATGVRGYDYVYWSSPIAVQALGTIYSSPTPGNPYKWSTLATNINSPLSSGNWQNASGNMNVGEGYIVRGSSNFGMAASSIPALFSGAVNNGIIPVTIFRGSNQIVSSTGPGNGVTISNFDDNWNLTGNPYPSAIKALDFLTANTTIQGFVYLWTHGTAPVSTQNPFYNSFQYNYTSNDYITYNGTGTTSGPTGFNGYIAAAQGFFVMMNDGASGSTTINFNNSMRDKTYANSQFYRTSSNGEEEKHRIWLDLLDANNITVRTLVGYVPEATYGLDRMYDAFKNTANDYNIYSLAEDKTLTIQGRQLPFDNNDLVPIGIRIMHDGEYKIAIAAVDGLFSEVGQSILLEDKLLGTIYDLRQNPYTFVATTGVINDRFVLRYDRNALNNPDLGTVNDIILTSNHGQLVVKSSIEAIQDVTVFDILGRQLFEAKSIGSKDFASSNISISQQALIVKIKLGNGVIVTRKIIL
jgi:hypothetical protein